MGSKDEESDQENGLDLFQEPADFYQPEKEPTFVRYTLKDGRTVSLRLVGHSPLWGHLLWNAAQVVSAYIEERAAELVTGKTVLELGAGAGLPSLVCAIHGASKVVVSDYPDADLIDNIRYNIDHCDLIPPPGATNITAHGYLWGNPVDSLQPPPAGFDLLILADILFNHSEHEKLVKTLDRAMKPGPDSDSTALVFFTPYRPWLLDKDLGFFQLADAHGFRATKIMEHVMDKVMFDDDPGDELLRRTVFAYEVTRKKA